MGEVGIRSEVFEPKTEEVAPDFISDQELFGMSNAEEQSSAEIESTIAALVEYYGDQQFQYKQYSGTVIEIITLCPPVRAALKDGPAAIIAWVDEYKVEEPQSEGDTESQAYEDEATDVIDLSHSEDAPLTSVVADEKQKDKPAKVTTSQIAKLTISEVVQKVDKKDKPEAKPVQDPVVYSSSEVLEEKPVAAQAVPSEPAVKIETTKERIEEEVVENNLVEPAIAETVVEDRENIEPVVVEAEVASAKESAVEDDAIIEEESIDPLVTDEAVETEDLPVTKLESKEVPHTEVVMNEPKDERPTVVEIVADTTTEEVEITFPEKAPDLIENWHKAAVEEPPLDTFFTQITEQLNEYIAVEEVIIAEAQLSIEIESVLEESLEKEVQPEFFALLKAVRSSEESLKKLYRATTKEECETCIDQIVLELSVILRALGYENPEKIIRDYLYGNSPDSLRKLIEALEASLCRVIRYEARQKTVQAPTRHIQVGKFVNYVMGTLFHKPVLSSGLDYV